MSTVTTRSAAAKAEEDVPDTTDNAQPQGQDILVRLFMEQFRQERLEREERERQREERERQD